MFGVDEKGRHYPIKNTPKKLYTLGEHFVLSDINAINAPLKQQVFRWFREKYGVYPTIMTETEDDSLYFRFIAEGGPEWLSFSKIYYTYEEAENACIDKLIELAKQQSITDDTLSKQQHND